MTPRSLKLWRSRLHALKRALARDLGEECARPLCQAVDRIGNRLAREIGSEALKSVESAKSVDRRLAVQR